MSNTRLALINWTYGQMKAETLGAQILRLENYQGIAPVHPTGGPDGGKDIIAEHTDGRKVVGGCFFPNSSDDKSFSVIQVKFNSDLAGALKNSAQIFVFITNASISAGEEADLRKAGQAKGCVVEIFDLERIVPILDSPRGFGLRFQTLDLKMSEEEQVSFFNNWENMILDEVKRMGIVLNKVADGNDELKQMMAEILSRVPATGATKISDEGAVV